jgi:hypothetical protein
MLNRSDVLRNKLIAIDKIGMMDKNKTINCFIKDVNKLCKQYVIAEKPIDELPIDNKASKRFYFLSCLQLLVINYNSQFYKKGWSTKNRMAIMRSLVNTAISMYNTYAVVLNKAPFTNKTIQQLYKSLDLK